MAKKSTGKVRVKTKSGNTLNVKIGSDLHRKYGTSSSSSSSSSKSSGKTVTLRDGTTLTGKDAQDYGTVPTSQILARRSTTAGSKGSSGVAMKDYQLKPGESVDAYNARIEGLRGAGGPVTTPPVPVVQTTSSDRATFKTNAQRLEELMLQRAMTPPVPGSDEDEEQKKDMAWSKMRMRKEGLDPNAPAAPEGFDVDYGGQLELERLDKEEKRRKSLYDKQKRLNDATYNATLDDIANTYSGLRQQMEASNKSYLGQMNQAGYASDAFRYTPQITAGSIYNAEQYTLSRLEDLAQRENAEVAKARLARDKNDYDALAKHMDELDKIEEERVSVITEQYDEFKKIQDAIVEQEEKSTRDNAIAGLVAEGITNPAQILDFLNYDDEGNRVGDFTLKEVSETLGFLKMPELGVAGAFSFDEKTTAALLGANLTMTELSAIQQDLNSGLPIETILGPDSGLSPEQAAAVKKALGVDPTQSVTPGVGADGDPIKEQMIRTRLFNKLQTILNKGPLSESDAERINGAISTFRGAGLSEQEILDELSGFSVGVNSAYNGAFRDLIVANTDTNDQQSQLMGKVSQLLSTGNYMGSMTAVENQAMKNAKKLDPDGYMGTNTAKTYLAKIDRVRTLLADAGFVGPIEGSYQKVLKRFKSKDAIALQAAIADLTADFRNDISGAAVTEAEAKFLEPLIADLTDSKANFGEKINAFQNRIMTQANSTRESVSLPPASYRQFLIPEERLQLYSNDTSSGIFTPKNGGGLDI